MAVQLYEASMKEYQFGRYDEALKFINEAIERAHGEIPEFSIHKYIILLALEVGRGKQGEIELGKGWAIGSKDHKRYDYIATDRRLTLPVKGDRISTIDYDQIEVLHMNNLNFSLDIVTRYGTKSFTQDRGNYEASSDLLSRVDSIKDKLYADATSPRDDAVIDDDRDIT